MTRSDWPLAFCLLLSSVVLFHQPLHSVLAAIHEVEEQLHLDLLPALGILVVAIGYQQYGKRTRAALQLQALTEKARDTERLFHLSTALAGMLEEAPLRSKLYEGLPNLCGGRSFWLVLRRRSGWDDLLPDVATPTELALGELDRLVASMRDGADLSKSRHGLLIDNAVCFSIYRESGVLGFLGVKNEPPLDASERETLAAAGALISLALHNVQAFSHIRHKASIDDLTGCLTRAAGLANLTNELKRARRTSQPLSILLLDVDQFKQINDTYGHVVGDQVLQMTSTRIAGLLRTTDTYCRYGGDEFLVVLPDTTREGSLKVAERILETVAKAPCQSDDVTLFVTVSVGATTVQGHAVDAREQIRLADEALYAAKHARQADRQANASRSSFLLETRT